MRIVTEKVKWAIVFENKPADNVKSNNQIINLVNESMIAWHNALNDYYEHNNEDFRAPYEYNERTTSGLFAAAIAKHPTLAGAVLMELPANKKNMKTPGRTDIVWVDQSDTIGINFELKQQRVNIDQYKKNKPKSNDNILDEIENAFFGVKSGLIVQSVRDFGAYQGACRFVNKSRDGRYHVGLLFCPVKLNSSISNIDIGMRFSNLKSKINCTLLAETGKAERISNKDLSKFYSCVHLYRPHEQYLYSLLTAAIVFRSPKNI